MKVVEDNDQEQTLSITYTPNVFAKRITQELLDQKPELVLQSIKLNQLVTLRQINEDDLKLFVELKPEHLGQWFLNSRFSEDEQLAPDEDFRLEVLVPKQGQPEVRIICRKEEKVKVREIVGVLELCKLSVIEQQKIAPNSDMGPTVDYVVEQADIDFMGKNNPGYKVGDKIPMPKQQAEHLLEMKTLRIANGGVPPGNLDGSMTEA